MGRGPGQGCCPPLKSSPGPRPPHPRRTLRSLRGPRGAGAGAPRAGSTTERDKRDGKGSGEGLPERMRPVAEDPARKDGDPARVEGGGWDGGRKTPEGGRTWGSAGRRDEEKEGPAVEK